MTTRRPASHFIDALWRTWLTGVDSVIRAGRILIEAKSSVPHGEWLDVLAAAPFHERTAQRLMVIARHPILSNADYASLLPPSWDTLHELSKLPDPVLTSAIVEGKITPALERHQVRKLWTAAPEAARPHPDYAIFHCPECHAQQLRRCDTRPSSLGEDREIQARLYDCDGCGKTILTEERCVGPFAKKSLPKTSKEPVEGARVTTELPREPQTGTR